MKNTTENYEYIITCQLQISHIFLLYTLQFFVRSSWLAWQTWIKKTCEEKPVPSKTDEREMNSAKLFCGTSYIYFAFLLL